MPEAKWWSLPGAWGGGQHRHHVFSILDQGHQINDEALDWTASGRPRLPDWRADVIWEPRDFAERSWLALLCTCVLDQNRFAGWRDLQRLCLWLSASSPSVRHEILCPHVKFSVWWIVEAIASKNYFMYIIPRAACCKFIHDLLQLIGEETQWPCQNDRMIYT